VRGIIAEYERSKILERTRRGLDGRAKAGFVPGGTAPLGYPYVKHASKGGHYEICPEEATLVQRIFQMYVQSGFSINAIAQQLTRERIPTQSDRRTHGPSRKMSTGTWQLSSIFLMLTNETYTGTLYYGKTESSYSPNNPDKKTTHRLKPSTTVVVMNPRAVCRANTGRRPGANDATRTKPASVLRAAGWPRRGARSAAASRRHGTVQQSSRGLAGHQAARGALGQRCLRRLLRRQLGCSQDRQERLRLPGQRALAIPARPTAPLLVLATALALGLCTTPRHGPATASHPYDVGQGGLLGGKHPRGRQRRRLAPTPTYEEPAAPVGRPRRGQGEPPPGIPARALGPIASAQSVPALRRQRRQAAFALVLSTSPPDIFLPRDGHDRGVGLLCQPHPPPPSIAIDALACHPRGRHSRLEGSLEPLLRQRRLRGQTLRCWYPSVRAMFPGVCPCFGQVEGAIQQRVAVHTRRGYVP